MKEKGILLVAVILLNVAGLVQAQEGELHGTLDVTYLSKYVWRGFDIYGDKSAIQTSVDFDLCGTGFGMGVMGHRANSSEYENGERWDYTLYYRNRLFEGETYVTNYHLGWVYYNYPDHPTKGTRLKGPNAALQELQAVLSWPKICSAGIVPTYILVKMWPAESDSYSGSKSHQVPAPGFGGTASGFAHIFMLDYPMAVPGFVPETPEQILNLHAELVYNDGVGPAGQDIDQDWSNAVFGVSTNFNLADELVLTTGVYYQVTMEETVNDDKDETWVSIGMKYAF